jgi:hypothetical protein
MTQFLVHAYCPWDESRFAIVVDNSNEKEARRQVVDKPVVCSHGHHFKVEDVFVIGVTPAPQHTRIPRVSYTPMETIAYLRGTEVVGDEPIPSKAMPSGPPRLTRKVSDGFITYIFEQELRSPYTDQKFYVRTRRDVFRKFQNQAEQMASRTATRYRGTAIVGGDAKAAVNYFLKRESPLSPTQLYAMLNLPPQTVYSALHALEREDKVVRTPVRSALLGRLYYSTQPKTRSEIINELSQIRQLELSRRLTVEEQSSIASSVDLHENEIKEEQESLSQWMPNLPEAEAISNKEATRPTATIPTVNDWFTEQHEGIVKVGLYGTPATATRREPYLQSYKGQRIIKYVDIPTGWLRYVMAWSDIPSLDGWTCQEGRYEDLKLIRCKLETLGGTQEKMIALPPLQTGKHGEELTQVFNVRTG